MGVPDFGPQAPQQALSLHLHPPHVNIFPPQPSLSPPHSGRFCPAVLHMCPHPDTSLAPGSASPLSVPPDQLRPPSPRRAALPGPCVSFGPCPASHPKSGSLQGGGQRRFPESLTVVVSSQMAGPGTSGFGMFLIRTPSRPPYVFLNLWYLIQLARPRIQLKMLSGLAQNYIFGYF